MNKITLWQKAAVLGSVWAASEIVVGNFLHSMKIPFTGEIMTAFAIYLFSATGMKWKQAGIIWRAGLIAAVMRMMNPGVSIFGPVIGMSIEALSIYIGVLIFGKNRLGFIVGGALALNMPLTQKIVNYLIVYGWDLITVFNKTANYIISSLKIKSVEPIHFILLMVAINSIVGILVAFAGCNAGSKPEVSFTENTKVIPDSRRISDSDKSFLRSALIIILNIAVIITLIIFIKSSLTIAAVLSLIYILIILFKYQRTVRYLRNYKFWIQLIIVTSLTAVTYSYFLNSDFMGGLIKACEMLLRAFVITFGFAAISIEFKNPAFFNLIKRKSGESFLTSLNFGFESVPHIIASLPDIKSLLKPKDFLSHLLYQTDVLLEKSTDYFINKKGEN